MKAFLTIVLIFMCPLFLPAQTYQVADSLMLEAYKFSDQGDFLKAAELYEASARSEKRCQEPRDQLLHYQLNHAAHNYHEANYYEKALELRKENLDLCIKVFGKDHENYASEANSIGWYYEEKGQYEKALYYYTEALESTVNLHGKEHLYYGIRLNSLANLYQKMGDYDKALPLFEETLENAKQYLGADHAEYRIPLSQLAFLYESMNQFNKALPLFKKVLELTETNLGKDHPEYVIRLNDLARLYDNMGEYSKALPLYLEVSEINEKRLGKDHSDYGISLYNLSVLYQHMGKYKKALPLSLEALRNVENNLGKDHPYYGSRLNSLAMLYRSLGQYHKALPLYKEALENAKKSLGEDHSFYGSILSNLAEMFNRLGEYDKAKPLFIEALENAEKSLGKDHIDYGIRLNNLATLYLSLGEYDKALPLYLEALESAEKSLGEDHLEYNIRLNNLAVLYHSMGLYEKALPLFIKTLENAEKTLEKDHSIYGERLNNLANLYQSMGQYDQALLLYLEALENTQKSLGKDHSGYGSSLHNLADLYENMGQYDKALPLYLEALENIENSLGKKHPNYGGGLNGLANLYQSMGQYDKALPLYFESLENAEKSLGKDHLDYGIRLNNLAKFFQSIGEYKKALPLYLEALENTEKNLGKNHSEYSIRLNNLAALYESLGQYDKALSFYLEAMENYDKSLGKDHPNYVASLNGLALLYRSMGEYEKVSQLSLESLNNVFSQLDQAFSFMSDNEKEQFRKKLGYNFEFYQSFYFNYAKDQPEVAAQVYDIELATKGMILQSSINMRQSILNSENPEALETFDEWIGLKNTLSQQYSKPISERRADLKALETNVEKLEATLTRISRTFENTQKLGSLTWKDIQSKLGENEVAIEFASFRYRDDKEWTNLTRYMALVLRKEDPHPYLVPLFEQTQLDSLLASTKASDANFVTDLYRGSEGKQMNTTKGYGAQLYKLIWAPLEPFLEPNNILYFAPSGSLHELAFAAIPVSDDELLSDRYHLNQLTTTAKLLETPKFSDAQPANIALYGGIAYDIEPRKIRAQSKVNPNYNPISQSLSDDLERGGSWTFLSGALTEVEAIAQLTKSKNITTNLYTDIEASESLYKSQYGNNSPRVVHIATHGFFFPDPKKKDVKNQLDEMRQETHVFKTSDNPLNRSGILFAGANFAWQGGELPQNVEDGILTAYEAANTMLNNTQLVVLSACETGLGDIKGSEGVFGLQRAFKAAGAEYLLMSLWKVPDTETAEFMMDFYKQWLSGKTIPEAFLATQKFMKIKYPKDPYKWAAFVLVR